MKKTIAVKESTSTLPDDVEDRAPESYPRCEVTTRVMAASESIMWMADAAEAGIDMRGGVASMGLALGRLGPKTSLDLILRLLRYTSVMIDGRRIEINSRDRFDEVFSGELLLLLDVLGCAVAANFESFTRGPVPPENKAAT